MVDPYTIIGWAWLAILIVWIGSSAFKKRNVRKQSARSRAAQVCLGVAAGLLIWGQGPWKVIAGPTIVPRSAGTAFAAISLTVMGLAFALWSRFVLGRNWSATVTVKQGHELVRRGPYALVRHPIYCGFLVALLGMAIARGNLGAFIGVAVVLLVFRRKSRLEEQFMVEQFGAEYEGYRSKVKALIPFIW
jgi:protein-S-isoprenylcysteine O-methyltransferase